MSSSAGTFSDGVLSRVAIGRFSRHDALRRGPRDRQRDHVTGRGRPRSLGQGQSAASRVQGGRGRRGHPTLISVLRISVI